MRPKCPEGINEGIWLCSLVVGKLSNGGVRRANMHFYLDPQSSRLVWSDPGLNKKVVSYLYPEWNEELVGVCGEFRYGKNT